MKRCVIVGGADIAEKGKVSESVAEGDFLIYCDGGLRLYEYYKENEYEDALRKMRPSLIVGDFDSFDKDRLSVLGLSDVETVFLPREKDDTDTFFAAKCALERGFDEFLLLGVCGNRFDHTLGNISILLYLFEKGKKAFLEDDFSRMEIVGKDEVIIDSCLYFSLLNISGVAKGIDIKGAKYELAGGEIKCDYQYGISNEVMPGNVARVSVKEGCLLLVKIYRER